MNAIKELRRQEAEELSKLYGIMIDDINESFLISVQQGNLKLTEYLLDQGAYINYRGGEALQQSIINNNFHMVQLLISNGANFEGRYSLNTVYSACNKMKGDKAHKFIYILNLLYEYEINIPPRIEYITACCEVGNIELLKCLIPTFSEEHMNIVYPFLVTRAIRGGYLDIVKLLCNHTKKVPLEAIRKAREGNNIEIIKFLKLKELGNRNELWTNVWIASENM